MPYVFESDIFFGGAIQKKRAPLGCSFLLAIGIRTGSVVNDLPVAGQSRAWPSVVETRESESLYPSHIVKPKKISWLRTPEISRFRGFFSRFLAFSQLWGLRIQSAEKKISFQKNGFGQDLNPVVPVFKGRKCDDFTHLLPFFRIFIC